MFFKYLNLFKKIKIKIKKWNKIVVNIHQFEKII